MIPSSQLGLTNSLDLYKCAKAFADIVIPQVSCWNEQKESWYGGLIVKCLSKPQRRRQRERRETKGCARALQIFVHFFAVLCKTKTWNDQVLRCLRNVDDDG